MLSIVVYKWVCGAIFVLNRVLSADLSHHDSASIWQLHVLLVEFKVLLEGVLDVLVVQDLAINDIAQVLEDHVDLGNWGRLNEVLHDLLMHAAHLYD